MVAFSLESIEDRSAVERRWRDLEARARPSFFLCWTWMSAWLDTSGVQPWLVVARDGTEEVALAFVAGPSADGSVALNETGDPHLDVGYIEYNGLLSPLGVDALADPFVTFLVAARRAGPLRGWRRLRLGGVPLRWAEACRRAGLWVDSRTEQDTFVVDLGALRETGQDVASSLSANTRQQVRRAIRLYEAAGPLAITAVAPGSDALAALRELAAMHQARWQAEGQPGSFASPLFEPFVRRLLETGHAGGEVELLRVTSGARTLGLLFNLLAGGRVLNYLGAFVTEADNRLKPGLVSHVLAMERHRAAGAASYDLLAGTARYKASLARPYERLVWVDARPRSLAAVVDRYGNRGLRAIGRVVSRRFGAA